MRGSRTTSRLLPGLIVVAATGLALASTVTLRSQTPPPTRPAAVVAAAATALLVQEGLVGSDACTLCHREAAAAHQVSLHATATTPDGVAGCEACHGPGEAHLQGRGDPSLIFSFADDARSPQEKADRCLTCHEGDATTDRYRASPHAEGTLDCSSCHTAHGSGPDPQARLHSPSRDTLLEAAGLEACLGCHQEVRATLNLNERHRVLEGVVACADCHETHDPSPRARLGGVRPETCTGCHTDKQGPFVFEHQSQLVEGCTTCHEPHGSVNRHLLSYQAEGDLCYSCHVEVPGFHKGGPPGTPLRFDSSTNCTNCHATIHGSNLDPYFLR